MAALVLVGAVRELIGKGSLAGFHLVGSNPLLIMVLPTGGFFVIGLLMGLLTGLTRNITAASPAARADTHH